MSCERCKQLKKIVDQQAELELAWTEAQSIVEAYLQQEIRFLHKAVEENIPSDEEIKEHFN